MKTPLRLAFAICFLLDAAAQPTKIEVEPLAPAALAPPPLLAPFGDGEYWVLAMPLSYRLWKTDKVIVIPGGFVTDLASVPRIFWSVLPKTGKYMSAAVLHDFLYADQRCTKEQADLILKMEMELFGVDHRQLVPVYWAVDNLGQPSWDENTKKGAIGTVRIVPKAELDKFLAAELDANQSWERLRKELQDKVSNGEMQTRTPGNENIALICADVVEFYRNAKR